MYHLRSVYFPFNGSAKAAKANAKPVVANAGDTAPLAEESLSTVAAPVPKEVLPPVYSVYMSSDIYGQSAVNEIATALESSNVAESKPILEETAVAAPVEVPIAPKTTKPLAPIMSVYMNADLDHRFAFDQKKPVEAHTLAKVETAPVEEGTQVATSIVETAQCNPIPQPRIPKSVGFQSAPPIFQLPAAYSVYMSSDLDNHFAIAQTQLHNPIQLNEPTTVSIQKPLEAESEEPIRHVHFEVEKEEEAAVITAKEPTPDYGADAVSFYANADLRY